METIEEIRKDRDYFVDELEKLKDQLYELEDVEIEDEYEEGFVTACCYIRDKIKEILDR